MRTNTHGFSLIELMVATATGLVVLAGALVFVAHNTQLLEFTKSELDRDRSGRLALDLLTDDLRVAGLGVGYDQNGNFAGLMLGSYTVPGGAAFGLNQTVSLGSATGGSYNLSTDDIGIRFANGAWRSIANYTATAGQICSGSAFRANDVVLAVADDGMTVQTLKLGSISAGSCSFGSCLNGCDDVTFTVDSSYSSGTNATAANYIGGEMAGAYKMVVWFVDTTSADPNSGSANLRRAEVTSQTPCTTRDQTCGQLVAYDVETVKIAINQWDPTTLAWVNQGAATALDRRRIRLDIEMVTRTRSSESRQQDAINMQLSPGTCVPSPCGTTDQIGRRVMRTSIEVRNSGRMNLRG